MRKPLAVGVLSLLVGTTAAWVLIGLNSGGERMERPVRQGQPVIEDATPGATDFSAFARIAAMPDDFDRNARLYELLAAAGAAHVKRLLAEAGTLPPVPHRYDVSRVLYVRFAAIDPAAAVDHVVAASYHSSWVAAVFRVWAHRDLDAAAARAATLSDAPKAIATKAILELDLDAAQRQTLATQLDDGSRWGTISALGVISAREAARGKHRDFASEGEAALLATDPRTREWRVVQLVRAWVGADPAAALAWLEGVSHQQVARSGQTAFTQVLVAKNPHMALDLLTQADSIWNNSSTVKILMRGLLKIDISDAIRSLDVVPPRIQRAARLDLIVAVRDHGASDLDFGSVFDWYSTLDEPIRSELAEFLAGAYAVHDPDGAFAWAMALEGDEANDAMRGVMYFLGARDRPAGERLLAEIESSAVQARAAWDFLRGFGDPQEAWRWARSVPREEQRPRFLKNAFQSWVWASPEGATRALLALPPDLRDQTVGEISWYHRLADLGLERAERIFNAVESETARHQLATAFVRHFSETDPNENMAAFYRRFTVEAENMAAFYRRFTVEATDG